MMRKEYTCRGNNEKVVWLVPSAPWVYDWYAEALIRNKKYIKAIENIEYYENITIGKHRTFEPYMRKCEAYIALWDIKNTEKTYKRHIHLYMGSWYLKRRNDLYEQIKIVQDTIYT